jgi:hypothetical protein
VYEEARALTEPEDEPVDEVKVLRAGLAALRARVAALETTLASWPAWRQRLAEREAALRAVNAAQAEEARLARVQHRLIAARKDGWLLAGTRSRPEGDGRPDADEVGQRQAAVPRHGQRHPRKVRRRVGLQRARLPIPVSLTAVAPSAASGRRVPTPP